MRIISENMVRYKSYTFPDTVLSVVYTECSVLCNAALFKNLCVLLGGLKVKKCIHLKDRK